MSAEELREIKTEVSAYLEQARKTQGLDMIFFMLTNIVAESSELLCAGNGAREKMISAFDLKGNPEMIELKGVVSRKETACTDTGFGTAAVEGAKNGKTSMESREYGISTPGSDGEYGGQVRKEQYSDDRMDGHDLH